jgi:hypothetical protein
VIDLLFILAAHADDLPLLQGTAAYKKDRTAAVSGDLICAKPLPAF